MRVLHLLNDIRTVGSGLSNVAVDLALEQSEAGHEVTVASAGGEMSDLLAASGVEHRSIDMLHRRPVPLTRATLRLATIVRERRPRVIHCHTIAATVLARLVSERYRFARVVATVHNEYQRGVELMASAHLVVGVSKAVTASMIRRGVPARKTATVINGVIGSKRLGAEPAPPALRHPAIVFCGGVSWRKGVDVLIAAFTRLADDHPEAQLYLVGNEDWKEFITDVRRSPLSARVHFEGFRPDPRPYMRTADVFVLPSRRDPMPLVLLEAMPFGAPIVASAVDGIPEALDGGVAGFLVPAEDSVALAEALRECLSGSEDALMKSRYAQQRARRFTTIAMSENYVALYQRLEASR